MGTMGYSIPAGIGAKMCTPDKQVVVVCGDGSFQMSMYELGTIAVNKVPIKILVMRNHYLGLVREHQEKTYEEHYFGVQLYDYPKYAEIAAAYDMDYFHCDSNETLDAELDRSSPATRPASWSAKSTATTTQQHKIRRTQDERYFFCTSRK